MMAMAAATRARQQAHSLGIGLAVVLFGLSVRGRPLPVPLAAISLCAAGILIWRYLLTPDGLVLAIGQFRDQRRAVFWSVASAVPGVLLAVYWRWAGGMPLLPSHGSAFVATAALIGIGEEIVFRGFVQGGLFPSRPLVAVIAAAILHASYKTALFLSPAAGEQVSTSMIFTVTILGGCFFGSLRVESGSVWPCVVVHAVFDVIAYADRTVPPSWVWG